MQVVVEKLQSYGAPPIETLTPQEARKQPTPTKAVMDVMKANDIAMPAPMVDKSDRTISVNGANLPIRVYTPKNGNTANPMIVYYHGGGWVIANLDTYDPSAQALAEKTGSVVVSVHYRQGPEHKFPTAHNDAFAAYQWVHDNAASLKGNPDRIAVAGESAGGNLACNVSIMARDKGIKMPVAQLLVYPVANNDMNNESYTRYANAKPLNKPMMEWFAKHYLNGMQEAADPRISLVKANLQGLPPTIVITAQIDPLHDEGKMLMQRLKDAGVTTDYEDFKGVTHEFFGMAAVLPQAAEAQREATEFLMKRLK
ncbi:alpha/beta hydrolase [Flaviaesturariibacter amylovorans]|uniref:Alpha/beta hydrolase n=2 Tax=Flaviaesturariibacter amylovorans TaxID=1084520 RepID=A0ABP8HU75_9BACT